jgi:hypothetical protein
MIVRRPADMLSPSLLGCIFEYFDVEGDANVTHTGQYMATIFMIKNTAAARSLVRRWLRVCGEGELITDSGCTHPMDGFIAPRNDQSIWSVLIKMYPKVATFDDRTWAQNWDTIADEPIQARRWR